MKAWELKTLGDPWKTLQIIKTERRELAAGTLRLRVEAADLSFADILQCQGVYQERVEPPFTPGMNAAGTVIEVSNDADIEIGQRVVGPTLAPFGSFADEAILPAEHAQPIPDGVTCITAMGAHVTYGTAWFALHQRGLLQPGETVLVLAAAGGVGSAALQTAKVHGCWVIAAAGGSEKTRICTDIGADAVIDYEADNLYESVMNLTDRRGVDVVYDPVGGAFFNTARRLLAWEGRLLVIGFASGQIPSAQVNHALVKNYSIVGVHMGGYRQRYPALVRRCYQELHQQLLSDVIRPFVSEVIGFDALPKFLYRLANRDTTGRIVLDPAE
jgi:NADPH2:quinone reductase